MHHLLTLLAGFTLSAAVSFLLTPILRRLAWRCGALDHADGRRKLQPAPVPHLGGLAVFAGLAAGATFACHAISQHPLALGLLPSGALMCLVGWYDDRHALRVRWKLLGQIAATLPLVVCGQAFNRLECCGYGVELGWGGIPLTIACLVAGANALNFLDGLDGLATTVGLTITAMICAVACCVGDGEAMPLAAVLAGALAGFWRFNRHPATIYLGDAGSMTIGLWLTGLSLAVSQRVPGESRLMLPAALLAVPWVDLGLAVLRRMLAGRAFWLPDRGHLHHQLLDRGWRVGKVVGVLAALSGASGAAAVAVAAGTPEIVTWGALAVAAVVAVRYRLVGGHEAERVGRSLGRWLARPLQLLDNHAAWRRPLKPGQAVHDLQNTG